MHTMCIGARLIIFPAIAVKKKFAKLSTWADEPYPEKGISMAQAWRMTVAIMASIALSHGASAVDITTSGCATAGVEAGCVMLESGGVVYDITAAKPKPDPGTFGTVKGSADGKISICQQGTILDPAQWTPDPAQSCPK